MKAFISRITILNNLNNRLIVNLRTLNPNTLNQISIKQILQETINSSPLQSVRHQKIKQFGIQLLKNESSQVFINVQKKRFLSPPYPSSSKQTDYQTTHGSQVEKIQAYVHELLNKNTNELNVIYAMNLVGYQKVYKSQAIITQGSQFEDHIT